MKVAVYKETKEENFDFTPTKKRLTPADEIFNRILWDESLEREDFVIGYIDRFTGLQEIDLIHFVTIKNASANQVCPPIPFHRVQYFKYRDTKVWDKTERLNLIEDEQFYHAVLSVNLD